MKTAITALLLTLAAAPAMAQDAAARLPNTLDGTGAGASRAPAQPPAPATLAPVPANPQSEPLLRTFIASVQGGQANYGLLTEGLATEMRNQEATIAPLIAGFGPVKSVRLVGPQQGGDVFRVSFDKAETDWFVGLNEGGKIAALLFRPAEQE